MTVAMQRANPMRMTPVMRWGEDRKKRTARANIRMGPITQFWTKDRIRTLVSLNTRPSSSYRTLAKGGYIIKIRPTPTAMARKIHKVSHLSKMESFFVCLIMNMFSCPLFPGKFIGQPSLNGIPDTANTGQRFLPLTLTVGRIIEALM